MSNGTPHRHGREVYEIEGETPIDVRARSAAGTARVAATDTVDAAPAFRFSRMGPVGQLLHRDIRVKVARAMTDGANVDGTMPAGYTYLGQFVDHDLTFDRTA